MCLKTRTPHLGCGEIRCFFDSPFVAHILSRFWVPLGGGGHAIHPCLCMLCKGRPILKRVYFKVHLEVIWGPKRGPESQLYSWDKKRVHLVARVAKRELLNIGSNLDRKKNLNMSKNDSKK